MPLHHVATDLTPDEVLDRIHELTLRFLRTGALIVDNMPAAAATSRTRATNAQETEMYLDDDEDFENDSADNRCQLVDGVIRRTSTTAAVRSPSSLVHAFATLHVVHQLALARRSGNNGRSMTIRDLYYHFKGTPHAFRNSAHCEQTVRFCTAALGTSRACLGLRASAKGTLAGCVEIRGGSAGRWVSPAQSNMEHLIVADLQVRRAADAAGTTRAILVIEKDAVFAQLLDARIWTTIPCVLVTGRGVPDIATRDLLHKLACEFPEAPVLGFCDYNPFGLQLMLVYAHGSRTGATEGYHYAVPRLRIAGMLARDVHGGLLPGKQAMSERDYVCCESLLRSPAVRVARPALADEITHMAMGGVKFEMECVRGGVVRWVMGVVRGVLAGSPEVRCV